MKRMLRALLITLLVLPPVRVFALELGLGAGPCDIQGVMPACDDGGWVAHVYAKHDFYEWQNGIAIGAEYHHFSAPESTDLDYSGGSGAFDYGGIYVRWRLK